MYLRVYLILHPLYVCLCASFRVRGALFSCFAKFIRSSPSLSIYLDGYLSIRPLPRARCVFISPSSSLGGLVKSFFPSPFLALSVCLESCIFLCSLEDTPPHARLTVVVGGVKPSRGFLANKRSLLLSVFSKTLDIISKRNRLRKKERRKARTDAPSLSLASPSNGNTNISCRQVIYTRDRSINSTYTFIYIHYELDMEREGEI